MKNQTPSFDPNGVGQKGRLFGLPYTYEDARVVIIPVPWEVTVSYSPGCAQGPEAILEASSQMDLVDPLFEKAWELGIYMQPVSDKTARQSLSLREKAASYIEELENGGEENPEHPNVTAINKASAELTAQIKSEALKIIGDGKKPAVLGGDHSTPLGLLQALAETHQEGFSILQIDAHADLRVAYEGFEQSHASIMYNASQLPQVAKLVQVGIRDYCQDEADLVSASKGRIKSFYDADLKEKTFEGINWKKQCDAIISELGHKVYISFDIDGLDPKLCPNTGTPVPGGLEFEQAVYLLKHLKESGKSIIGFDLCEVSPGEDEWDANVGARVLYRLCNLLGFSA